MAKSFPFESKLVEGQYDRAISAQDERDFNKLCWSNGVFAAPLDSLMVVAGSGMTVQIKPGGAHIEGARYIDTSTRNIKLSSASAGLNRIDRIVLRFDTSEDKRNIEVYLKEGISSTSPTAQDIVRQDNFYELVLADIYIPKGATSISQANISDRRPNPNLCGLVHPAFPTSDFVGQFNSQITSAIALSESIVDGTVLGKLAKQVGASNITESFYRDNLLWRPRDDEGYKGRLDDIVHFVGEQLVTCMQAAEDMDNINEHLQTINQFITLVEDVCVSREKIVKDGITWIVKKYSSGDIQLTGHGKVTFPALTSVSGWYRAVKIINLPLVISELNSAFAQGSKGGAIVETNDFTVMTNTNTLELQRYAPISGGTDTVNVHLLLSGTWK